MMNQIFYRNKADLDPDPLLKNIVRGLVLIPVIERKKARKRGLDPETERKSTLIKEGLDHRKNMIRNHYKEKYTQVQ